jgi:DNA-binding cell septation regulator SpoVG
MSDTTTSVTINVHPLVRAYGKGRLKHTTVVALTISDVELVLQGVQIVEDRHGHLRVEMPQTKHPATGISYPAIAVPPELHRCIEVSVLELVPGSRVIVTQPEEASL